MRAPANVCEQTSRVAQPPLFCRLIQTRRPHESVGPGDQLLAMLWRTRAQHIEILPRREQPIPFALNRWELTIEQAFAHAERRNDDLLRPHDAHDMFEHERRISQQGPPSL